MTLKGSSRGIIVLHILLLIITLFMTESSVLIQIRPYSVERKPSSSNRPKIHEIYKDNYQIIACHIISLYNKNKIQIPKILTLSREPGTIIWTFTIFTGPDYQLLNTLDKKTRSHKRSYSPNKIPKRYHSVALLMLREHKKKDWPKPVFIRIK